MGKEIGVGVGELRFAGAVVDQLAWSRKRNEDLFVSFARATRGLRRPSLDARSLETNRATPLTELSDHVPRLAPPAPESESYRSFGGKGGQKVQSRLVLPRPAFKKVLAGSL